MGCTVSLRHILQQVAGPIGTKSPLRVSLRRQRALSQLMAQV
jgi:hypothetical protein